MCKVKDPMAKTPAHLSTTILRRNRQGDGELEYLICNCGWIIAGRAENWNIFCPECVSRLPNSSQGGTKIVRSEIINLVERRDAKLLTHEYGKDWR